ncbi:MAG: NINE protein [Microcystis aeruginosa Ma_SC_T_19800800_S464]|nr:MAG: NINE protein [Microcystis aeruginosa Ma_SC_T_19800800_S464]
MRNRTIAALLAFFLGYLGIHKFYLGENLAGILYLLFFWTFIPGIIAFFEFIG